MHRIYNIKNKITTDSFYCLFQTLESKYTVFNPASFFMFLYKNNN